MAQVFISWAELELPSPIVFSGLGVTASAGTVAPVVSIPLASYEVTSAQGAFLGGINRVFLSWAELALVPAVVTTGALTGFGLTASAGMLRAGNLRVFLSWAELELPTTNKITGQVATASAGILTPVFGSVVTLVGQEVTAAAGAIVQGRGAVLTGHQIATVAGVLRYTDDPVAYAGFVTPTILPTFVGQQATTQAGLLTVTVDGSVVIPLVGLSAAAGAGGFGIDMKVTLSSASLQALLGTIGAVSGVGSVTVALTGDSAVTQLGYLTTSGPVVVLPQGPRFEGSGGGKLIRRIGERGFLKRVETLVESGVPIAKALAIAGEEDMEDTDFGEKEETERSPHEELLSAINALKSEVRLGRDDTLETVILLLNALGR